MRKRASSAVVVVAATALWLTLDQTTQPIILEGDRDEPLPQTYLENVTYWRYGETGAREETLQVASGQRLEGRSDVQMQAITVTGADDRGGDWSVTAGSGVWWETANMLNLRDEVTVSTEGGASRIRTAALDIDTARETARTQARVDWISPRSQTTGYGLELDMANGVGKLLRNVETRYAPQ